MNESIGIEGSYTRLRGSSEGGDHVQCSQLTSTNGCELVRTK
jgi:hypothetical protein